MTVGEPALPDPALPLHRLSKVVLAPEAEPIVREPALREPALPLREPALREMTWRDIPALAALELELFPADAWSEQTWWAELAGRPRRCYVVAEQGGAVVGYAGLDRGGEVADVMTIAVAPPAQGQRLGTLLMGWLVVAARCDGAEHLMLEVRADNVAAQRLYTKAGFVRVSVRRRYYQPGDVDAHILRLHLVEPAASPAGDTTPSPADDTTPSPDGESTASLAGGTTASPAEDTAVSRAAEATASRAGEATASRAGEATVSRAGDTTVSPAGDTTVSRAGDTTVSPAGDAILDVAGAVTR